MKKTFYLFLAMTAPAFAQSVPIKIKIIKDNPAVLFGRVQIQSTVDSITVSKVVLNRGNCRIKGEYVKSKLKFGEIKTIEFLGCEDLIEIKLQTSQGDYTVSGEELQSVFNSNEFQFKKSRNGAND